MSYAAERTINDADSHLMELPDFLSAHAEASVARALPDLPAVLAGGQFDPSLYANREGHDADTVAKLTALGDNLTKGPKWHDALGAFSGSERGTALDLLGFERQVIFSSFCARLLFEARDDVRYAALAAHNRAMAAFCDADPRLLGVAMVTLDDVEAACREIRACKELGLAAIWIPADAPGGRSPGHSMHEPIWALLAETGLPFILHVGSAPLAIGDDWVNDGRTDTVYSRGGPEIIGSKDLTVIHHASQRFISTLVLDGVLEAHPQLRGGVIEIGAGWVPDMIRRLDYAADIWSRSEPQLARFTRTPSEQIQAQLRFTPYPFEDVAQIVSESCAELYMFSSDYPHAEGGRDPIGRFARSTAALTAEDQAKFFATNFLTLYPSSAA